MKNHTTNKNTPSNALGKIRGARVVPNSFQWGVLGALFLFLLICSGGFAQNFIEIRRFLDIRDRLDDLKLSVEKMVNAGPDARIDNPEGVLGAAGAQLLEIEKNLADTRKIRGPLAEHYRQMLGKHVSDVKMLFPILQRKYPQVANKQNSVVVGNLSLALEQRLPDTPIPTAVTASGSPAPEPRVSLFPVPTVALKELVPRRKYFQPISPRLLLTRNLKLTPVAPLSRPLPPATFSVLVSSSTLPVASFTATASPPTPLPPPVAYVPPPIMPLQPPVSGDPQIRQSPGMRPLAIMIENHNQARPQTGIGEAEVVYEIPVEGGITRFMGLFYHVAGILGPVRSCRDYFIDRALEVNALYVHCGGSPQGYKHIEDTTALAIDEISSGEPFSRDNSRKAPHNLYVSPQKLIDFMGKKFPMELPYQRLPLLFGETPTYGTILNKGVTIRYHGNYSVAYRFNTSSNCYDRYMNGQQHLDRVTSHPVSPGEVIIQEAVMKVVDDKGRQDISFIGQGTGYLLAGGTILRIHWQKAASREFTRFYDDKGAPVTFSNSRPIWIQVVSPANQVVFDPPAFPVIASTVASNPIRLSGKE